MNEDNSKDVNIKTYWNMEKDDVYSIIPTDEQLNEFMLSLNITNEYLFDLIPNTERKTEYRCDFCREDCFGDVYRFEENESKNGRIWHTYMKDMCEICHEKDPKPLGENDRLCKCPVYDGDESYKYKITALKKLSETEYLYVIEEANMSSNQDIHYYLKYFKNNTIILDHELQTYNPYFGCKVTNLQKINENTIQITYYEKHKSCIVDIEYDEKKSHKIFIKSKPKSYARSQNESTRYHEIGKIVKFVKDSKEMIELCYWR